MNRNKKLMVALSMCLVAIISIGVTYALLGVRTDEVVNKFNVAGDDAFDAELNEDKFTDDEKKNAEKVLPGTEISKNPTIKNISKENIDGWVAMRMVLRKGDTTKTLSADDLALLNRVLEIQINYTDWERKEGGNTDPFKEKEIFYYKNKLSKDQSTSPLFEKVVISKDATTEDLQKIREEFKGFDIVLMGAAAQYTDGSTLDSVKTSLDELLK